MTTYATARKRPAMKGAIFSTLFMLTLAACTQPLGGGAYMKPPSAQVDKVTAGVGKPVEVTLTGGFEASDRFYQEEFTEPGVNLGACISSSNVATQGGLCSDGEQPLPEGLSLVGSSSFAKNFGAITVKRGESRTIEHAFTFTSNSSGTFKLVPTYLFKYNDGRSSGFETGTDSIIQITFE